MNTVAKAGCLAFILLMAGCSTTNQIPIAEYDHTKEPNLPPLSVHLKQPSKAFYQGCTDFDQKSLLNHCQINPISNKKIGLALTETGQFVNIDYADKAEYQLLVSVANYNREEGKEIGQAVIAGATLMLAPMAISIDVKVEAELLWNGVLIESFDFSLPVVMKASLLDMNKDADADIAKGIASQLTQQLQKDNVFDAERVAKKLSANIYASEWMLPENLAGNYKEGMVQFHHPFYGAQARYINQQFQFSYIDVFSYPIRKINWDDQEKTLLQELDSYRHEVELMSKENYIKNLSFAEAKSLLWSVKSQPLAIKTLRAKFLDQEGVMQISDIYLFIQKDKFIKVRSTFSEDSVTEPDVDGFVKALIAEASAPDESLFMAQMRHKWRSNSMIQ